MAAFYSTILHRYLFELHSLIRFTLPNLGNFLASHHYRVGNQCEWSVRAHSSKWRRRFFCVLLRSRCSLLILGEPRSVAARQMPRCGYAGPVSSSMRRIPCELFRSFESDSLSSHSIYRHLCGHYFYWLLTDLILIGFTWAKPNTAIISQTDCRRFTRIAPIRAKRRL